MVCKNKEGYLLLYDLTFRIRTAIVLQKHQYWTPVSFQNEASLTITVNEWFFLFILHFKLAMVYHHVSPNQLIIEL